jgi:hypothetical protein
MVNMSKPNRFEQMAEQALASESAYIKRQAVGLLRRQHAALVQLVTRQPTIGVGVFAQLSRHALLQALAQWTHGATGVIQVVRLTATTTFGRKRQLARALKGRP